MIDPLKLQDTDVPYATFGVLVLVIGAATVAASGALAYWAPKIWGRDTSNGLALLAVLAGFLGAVIGGVALVVNGFQIRIDSLADASGFLNGVAVAGSRCWPSPSCSRSSTCSCAALPPATTRGKAKRSSGPPPRRRPSATSASCPPISSAEPLLDLREPVTEGVG